MLNVGWTTHPEDVQDLVQEVYCRLLAARSGTRALEGRPNPQIWRYLQRIARSVVIDALRSRRAIKRGGSQSPPAARRPPRAHAGSHSPGEPAVPGPDIEERLLTRERAELLRRRVREIFPGEQGERNLRVLELAAVEGLTSGEISRRLAGALTPSSVHTVLHRVRRQLAAAMVSSSLAAVG
jgi:RNA polymerase sigma factor (sigma-70 family)